MREQLFGILSHGFLKVRVIAVIILCVKYRPECLPVFGISCDRHPDAHKKRQPQRKKPFAVRDFFHKITPLYLFVLQPAGCPCPESPKITANKPARLCRPIRGWTPLLLFFPFAFLSGLPAEGSHEILPCAALSVKRKIADNAERRVCVKINLPLGRRHTVTINGDHHICRHSESNPLSLRHSGRR